MNSGISKCSDQVQCCHIVRDYIILIGSDDILFSRYDVCGCPLQEALEAHHAFLTGMPYSRITCCMWLLYIYMCFWSVSCLHNVI